MSLQHTRPRWGLAPAPTDLPPPAQALVDLRLPVLRDLRTRHPTQGFLSGGRTRHPPAPAAATFPARPGSRSQRGPDTTAPSCAISSGILPLASFLQSQPSPAQQQCPVLGATDPQACRQPSGGWQSHAGALLHQCQPHLAGAGPVQLPVPVGGWGASLWASPAAPASVESPWPPPWSRQPCWRELHQQSPHLLPAPQGQRPAHGAGPRKAPQISLRREHGAAGIMLQQWH